MKTRAHTRREGEGAYAHAGRVRGGSSAYVACVDAYMASVDAYVASIDAYARVQKNVQFR